ncbi:MAG TPA: glycosyltransferase N-terminal domain-containing protein, partial [Vulgatibacter sp.]
MPFAYSVASWLAFLLAWPFLFLHRKTRDGQRRRMGFHPQGWMRDAPRPRIWLHGASAGDLLALKPMVAELKRRFPGCTVVMSTLTNSGFQMAKERLGEVDFVTYQPWDLPGATSRTVRAIDPDLLVLEYAEIWPNLIRAARRHGAKIALTNGRFAADKLERYQRLFALVGNPLANVDLFLMREDDEAERVLRLGAPAERVRVTGNTKFDTLAVAGPAGGDDGLARAIGFAADRPLFIAGSTHEGEEALLVPIFRRLREAHPALRFAIAPRYVERAPRIVSLAQSHGFTAGLRSKGAADADLVVVDTIGELSAAYRLATLVFVGGSFTNRGGQNILEPAAHGKPVLFGPNMKNFQDSVQALVGRGGIQVADPEA